MDRAHIRRAQWNGAIRIRKVKKVQAQENVGTNVGMRASRGWRWPQADETLVGWTHGHLRLSFMRIFHVGFIEAHTHALIAARYRHVRSIRSRLRRAR